ncbi:MAG: IclR family transcriptional regulator [Bacteroidota bacterium]
MLGTFEKANKMLILFTLETPDWGITELAAELGWSTSTTYDIASSLVTIGLLRKTDIRRYKVGWRVLELSHVLLGSSSLQTESRRQMEEFAAEYDDTMLLGVLGGGKILFADKIVSPRIPHDTFSTPDGRFMAHCTAAGKVIMAHLPAEVCQAVLNEHGLEPMTEKSIRSAEALHEELEIIKAQGHAYDFEESVVGIGSVAAPIFDYFGIEVAALCIAAPIQQFERRLDSYRREVVRAAKQVSERLGYWDFKG